MRKFIKLTGIGVALLAVAIQFYRPERTNPPVDESQTLFAAVPVPEEVQTIFKRSCFDCHSNETRWPWYSSVAPAMWLVARDVKEGRSHMNLSEFGKYKPLRGLSKLDMMCENMQDGVMPLPHYLTLHPKARPSAEEIDRFCAWVDSLHATFTAEAQ